MGHKYHKLEKIYEKIYEKHELKRNLGMSYLVGVLVVKARSVEFMPLYMGYLPKQGCEELTQLCDRLMRSHEVGHLPSNTGNLCQQNLDLLYEALH